MFLKNLKAIADKTPNDTELGSAVRKLSEMIVQEKTEMTKIYLAIPYSGMEESSYKQANEATVELLRRGYNVLSPITHSHPLSMIGGLPGTWEFWSKIDYQFLDWADEMWILVPKEGKDVVEKSVGVQAEIQYAAGQLMPITYFTVIQGTIHILND